MQYSITINQAAAIEAGLEVDIVDLALIDFLKKISNTSLCTSMQDGGTAYFSVPYSRIIEEMPILHIKTTDGVYRRFKKLELAGLIEMHPDNAKLGRVWFSFGRNYLKLEYKPLGFKSDPSDQNPYPLGSKSVPPSDEKPTLQYTNTVYNHNVIDNSATQFENWLHSIKNDPSTKEVFTLSRKVPSVKFDEYFDLFTLEAKAKKETYHKRADLLSHFLNFSVSKYQNSSTQKFTGGPARPADQPARYTPPPAPNPAELKEPKYRPLQ